MSPDKNVEAVRTKLLERSKFGLEKYKGVTTERADTDLVGWLNHLQEELMDAAVYVQRSMVDVEAQEPVAYAYYSDKYKKPMLEQTATARGYEGEWKIVPLFAAPVVSPDVAALMADFEEVTESRNRLVRKIDVILNGEEGAAKQASLCDLVGQIQSLKTELEAAQKDAELYRWLRDTCEKWSWVPSIYNADLVSGFSANNTSYIGFSFEAAIEQAKGGVK